MLGDAANGVRLEVFGVLVDHGVSVDLGVLPDALHQVWQGAVGLPDGQRPASAVCRLQHEPLVAAGGALQVTVTGRVRGERHVDPTGARLLPVHLGERQRHRHTQSDSAVVEAQQTDRSAP